MPSAVFGGPKSCHHKCNSPRLLTPTLNGRESVDRRSCRSAMEVYRSRCCTPMACEFTKTGLPHLTDRCYPDRLSKSLNVNQPRNIYNAAKGSVYQRFSPNDWFNSNRANFDLSEQERGLAERIRSDCFRAIRETDSRTFNRQTENTKRLANRVQDISLWKNEVVDEIRYMETEMGAIEDYRRLLERALHDTVKPLNIAEECLAQREGRKEIDKVHDDVEKALSKEVCLIKCVQNKLRKYLQKNDAQQKLNRAALMDLERDSVDKHHAQHLDERMHNLRNASTGISFHSGIECFDNTVSSPDSWTNYTRNNLMRSQKEREASERLRGDIDALLRQCSNQMWHSFNAVNNAFNARLHEVNDARSKLMAHLNRTNQTIVDMERNMDMIRSALAAKEAPLKVAQTRLEERTRRMSVENCRDDSMNHLIREVNEIKDSIRYLNDKMAQAQSALSRLNRTKATLEHDIGVKDNSLNIDNVCMTVRKTYPMDSKAGPLMSVPNGFHR